MAGQTGFERLSSIGRIDGKSVNTDIRAYAWQTTHCSTCFVCAILKSNVALALEKTETELNHFSRRFIVAGVLSFFGASAAYAVNGQASSLYDRQVAQVTPGSDALTGTKQMMVVRISVSDYARFRPSFDSMESAREAAGISNPQVFHNATNQNDVAVFFDIVDVAKAKAFMGTDMLRAKMKDAGVLGPPTILFT